MDSSSAPLRSKSGFTYIWVALLLVVLLGLWVYFLPDNRIVFGLLILLTAWLILTWLSLRLSLNEDGLEIRSLWGTRKLPWKNMAALHPSLDSASRVPALQYLLTLSNFKASRTYLMLLPFDNREELLREIINSAWRANPNVRLASSLTSRYGFPPYSRRRKAG